jgi:hypothetical protein
VFLRSYEVATQEQKPEEVKTILPIFHWTVLALKAEIKRQTIEQPKRASGRSFASVVTRKRPALNRAGNSALNQEKIAGNNEAKIAL